MKRMSRQRLYSSTLAFSSRACLHAHRSPVLLRLVPLTASPPTGQRPRRRRARFPRRGAGRSGGCSRSAPAAADLRADLSPGSEGTSIGKSHSIGRGLADDLVMSTPPPTIQALGNSIIILRHLFPRVTPEPRLQFHAKSKVGLCYILSRPFLEEHNLRLLRKALFHGRY
jgi:hypothetical protein